MSQSRRLEAKLAVREPPADCHDGRPAEHPPDADLDRPEHVRHALQQDERRAPNEAAEDKREVGHGGAGTGSEVGCQGRWEDSGEYASTATLNPAESRRSSCYAPASPTDFRRDGEQMFAPRSQRARILAASGTRAGQIELRVGGTGFSQGPNRLSHAHAEPQHAAFARL